MAIWTDGTDFVIATGWGIARRGKGEETSFLFPRAGLRRDQDPPEIVSLVVLDDRGKRALVQRAGEAPSIWTHDAGGGRLAPCEAAGVEAIAAAPGGPLVAFEAAGAGAGAVRAVLRSARLDGTKIVLGDEIGIPEAPKLTWAKSIVRDGEGWAEAPPRDDEEDEDDDDDAEAVPFDPRVLGAGTVTEGRVWWQGAVRLSANRFGVGVSSTYGGLVGVLDGRTLSFRLVARVPSLREQFDLFALPMPSGMVVTLVANYRHSEVVYVDEGAAVRGNRTTFGRDLAWGLDSPGLAWDDATALVSQTLNDDRVFSLKLPDLTAKAFGKDPGRLIDVGSTADGAAHLIATTQGNFRHPKSWQLALWTRRGARWTSRELDVPEFRAVEPEPVVAPLERARGAPTLAMVPEATPWRGAVGAEVVLRVRVQNRGGEASGLWLEAGGPALGEGLLRVEAVTVAGSGAPVAFEQKGATARVELSACPIQAGYAVSDKRGRGYAPPTPPPPSLVLELHVRGVRAGQGLLSVRVGPKGATGTTGSGMVGRSFLVEP